MLIAHGNHFFVSPQADELSVKGIVIVDELIVHFTSLGWQFKGFFLHSQKKVVTSVRPGIGTIRTCEEVLKATCISWRRFHS